MSQSANGSRKKLPYYQLYPDDFDLSENVRNMSLADVGLYILCLNSAWRNGSIPDNPEAVSLAIGKPLRQVKRSWDAVRRCFDVISDEVRGNRLVSSRLEDERKRALAKSEQALLAINTRYGRTDSVPTKEIINVVPCASVSVSGSVSESEKKEKDALKPNGVLDDFEEFRQVCEGVGLSCCVSDLQKATFAWKALDFEQKIAALEGLRARKECGEFDDPGFRPLPQNYLLQHRWTRPLRNKQAPTNKLDDFYDGIVKDLEAKSKKLGAQ